jgi:group I intron endonuclease
MIGIYKITSPTNKIYVGQSINIKKRFKDYLLDKTKYKNQIRLVNSINKYGIENHIFEILEICEFNQLNICERKWQDFYNVIGEQGLNCKLQNCNDKSGKLSEETKLKISLSNKGKNLGNKKSKESIEKSASKIRGTHLSNEHKEKISKAHKGKKLSQKQIKAIQKSHSKKVICLDTNKIWNSAKECSKFVNINYYTLMGYLNGSRTNKTNLKYV